MTVFFFASNALLSAALYGFRLLPSLHSDTMLIQGTPYPTAQWVHRYSITCVLMSVPFLVGGAVGLLTLNESRRRYIASLPRWQQWLIWPFQGVSPSEASIPKVPPSPRA